MEASCRRFPDGVTGTVSRSGDGGYIVWQMPHGTVTASSAESEMTSLLDKIAQVPGAASVTSPYSSAGSAQISSDRTIAYVNVQFDRTATQRQVNPSQGVSEIIAVPSTSPEATQTSDLINHLRADVIPPVEQGTTMKAYVGGTTASNDDFASMVTSKLPLFIVVIALLGMVLLVIAFRSLLIPLLGALLNVPGSPADPAALAALTPRELEVLRLVALGLSNQGDRREAVRHSGHG